MVAHGERSGGLEEGAPHATEQATSYDVLLTSFPRPSTLARALMLLVGAANLFAVFVSSPKAFVEIGLVLFVAFALMGSSKKAAKRRAKAKRVDVRIHERTILFGHEAKPIPCASIEEALIVPRPTREGSRASVVLRLLRGDTFDLSFADVETARAFLKRIEASPARKPASFRFFFGIEVTVGSDGVLVAWPYMRRRRFVAWSDLSAVLDHHSEIVLVRKDGSELCIGTGFNDSEARRDRHAALIERIVQAKEELAREERAPAVAVLDRAGRTKEQWLADLHALGTAGGTQGYRVTALDPQVLVRVAVDPSQSEDARVGAAVALRASGGAPRLSTDEGERLRAAGDAAASPRVRLAVERIFSSDEHEETLQPEAAPRRLG